MQLEKYKEELDTISIKQPNEKLLEEILHTLTMRQLDFKTFFSSDAEQNILIENEFNEIEGLKNYERTLKIGEHRN